MTISITPKRPGARVHVSDISAAALHTTTQNVAALGADIGSALGSWFGTDRPSEKKSYDITVPSPPYIEAGDAHLGQGDLRFEPQGALIDFLDNLFRVYVLATDSPTYLKNDGWLLLGHGCGQGAQVRAVLAEYGFSCIDTLPNLAGLDRVTLGAFDHGN